MGARSSRNTTQNNRSDGHLLEYFRQSFVRGGGGNSGPSTIPFAVTATGGTKIPADTSGNGYVYHVFLTSDSFSGTLSPQSPGLIEVLVVAGGGGGGDTRGGGGGAGGVRYNAAFPISSLTPYSIIIGSGGNGQGTGGPLSTRGSDSSFGPMIAKGGGAASGRYPYATPSGNPQRDGGSGGGGGVEAATVFGYGYNPSTPAPVLAAVPLPSPYPITQGYNGGVGFDPGSSGGGGGAGGAGAPYAFGYHGGLAGSFPSFPSPIIYPVIPVPVQPAWNATVTSTGYYAGGGAGGTQTPGMPVNSNVGGRGPFPSPGAAPSSQPYGGGGNGGQGPVSPSGRTAGAAGLSYTGGGGGGGADNVNGGSGGSGIVLVRYPSSL